MVCFYYRIHSLFFHIIQEIEYINITWQLKSYFHLSREQNQIFTFLSLLGRFECI